MRGLLREALEGRDIRIREMVREVVRKGGEGSGEKGEDTLRGVVREKFGRALEEWYGRREGTRELGENVNRKVRG